MKIPKELEGFMEKFHSEDLEQIVRHSINAQGRWAENHSHEVNEGVLVFSANGIGSNTLVVGHFSDKQKKDLIDNMMTVVNSFYKIMMENAKKGKQ